MTKEQIAQMRAKLLEQMRAMTEALDALTQLESESEESETPDTESETPQDAPDAPQTPPDAPEEAEEHADEDPEPAPSNPDRLGNTEHGNHDETEDEEDEEEDEEDEEESESTEATGGEELPEELPEELGEIDPTDGEELPGDPSGPVTVTNKGELGGDTAPLPEDFEIDQDPDEDPEPTQWEPQSEEVEHSEVYTSDDEATQEAIAHLTRTMSYLPVSNLAPDPYRAKWLSTLLWQCNESAHAMQVVTNDTRATFFRRESYKRDLLVIAPLRDRLARYLSDSLSIPAREVAGLEPGYRTGELDEDELWQVASRIDDPTPFGARIVATNPGFAVGIMVDCSGSMSSHEDKTAEDIRTGRQTPSITNAASAIMQAVHQALTSKGIACHAWGFTSGTFSDSSAFDTDTTPALLSDRLAHANAPMPKGYSPATAMVVSTTTTPKGERYGRTLHACGEVFELLQVTDPANPATIYPHLIGSYRNNPDGAALLAAAHRLTDASPEAKGRLIIQISDGQPVRRGDIDHGYVITPTDPKPQYINQLWGELRIAVEEARRLGVKVLHIGVGDAFNDADTLNLQSRTYEGNFANVPRCEDAAPVIARAIQRAIDDL